MISHLFACIPVSGLPKILEGHILQISSKQRKQNTWMHVFSRIIENFHFWKEKFSHFLIEKIGFNGKIWKGFPSIEKMDLNKKENSQINKKETQYKTPNHFYNKCSVFLVCVTGEDFGFWCWVWGLFLP